MALAFGSIFNLLVRRFIGADEQERMNLVKVLKERVMAVVGRIRARRMGERLKTE